jgi:hypothetical protein
MDHAMKYTDRLTAEELATVKFWAVFRKLVALGLSPNEHESERALTKAHEMLHENGYTVSNIPPPIKNDPGFTWRVKKRLSSQKQTKPVNLAAKTMFDGLKIKRRNRAREDDLAQRTLDAILEWKDRDWWSIRELCAKMPTDAGQIRSETGMRYMFSTYIAPTLRTMGYKLANWQDHHKGQHKSRAEKKAHVAHYKLIPIEK